MCFKHPLNLIAEFTSQWISVTQKHATGGQIFMSTPVLTHTTKVGVFLRNILYHILLHVCISNCLLFLCRLIINHMMRLQICAIILKLRVVTNSLSLKKPQPHAHAGHELKKQKRE
jgi:hypothetical protein